MKKIVFLFPGQGSQYIGMGKAFYEHYAVVRRLFEQASETLGMDLKKNLFRWVGIGSGADRECAACSYAHQHSEL